MSISTGELRECSYCKRNMASRTTDVAGVEDNKCGLLHAETLGHTNQNIYQVLETSRL